MLKKLIVAGVLTASLWTLPVHAAAPKTYQVTGPVLELTADTIVVQKGKDRWEIARDSGTKVTGDLKVGSKVTIEYRMSAASVEVKPEKGAGKTKSKTKG
ncbi:MAG: hypothetical protein QOJ16_3795 [Acidobacteriota bacterium]|nr:hypothetical protein [Acidobacteriota bacterium]